MIDDDDDDDDDDHDDDDHDNYGYVFIDYVSLLGDIDAALSYYEKALTILTFTIGNDGHQ